LRHLQRAVGPGDGGASDAQLLECFVSRRDDAAFEVLVWRHGGMVLNICGRLLRQAEDAEDVFQATFLALARRAGSIGKRESLGSWLYKVAYRLALRVRARAAREAALCQSVPEPQARGLAESDAGPDLRPLLDDEINRLPEKYRAAVILYYLQGKTTEEAARQLGCARGTVCSRLSWARQRLRSRLIRRGLALGAVGLGVTLAPAVMPAALIRATVKAAVLFNAGHPAGALTGQAVALAEGVLRAMMLTKMKAAALLLFVLGSLGLVAGLSTHRVWAEKSGADEAPALVRGSGDSVLMAAAARAKLGIQVAEVKSRPPAKARVLQLTGVLAIDRDRMTRVQCRFAPAEVVEIGRPEGKGEDRPLRPFDKVRKGQLLAVLESTEVGVKKKDLYLALAQLDLDMYGLKEAERMYKAGFLTEAKVLKARRAVQTDQNAVTRAKNSLSNWGIPARDIEALWKAGAERERPDTKDAVEAHMKHWGRVELTASVDGTIVERNVSRNDLVRDSTANLFQIARLDRLVVLAQVSETDMLVLQGLKAEQRSWDIRPSAQRDAPALPGRIEDLRPAIDPKVHPALARGFVENAEGRLHVGQAVTATVTLPPPAGEVTLPATAIVEEGRQTFVFVQPNAKKLLYEQRRVSIVRRGVDVVHVRSRLTPEEEKQGLRTVRPGERVVTAGSVEIKAILDDLRAAEER
jgi:cobalt-zinc-cadmium efflux system membrane fusion protein